MDGWLLAMPDPEHRETPSRGRRCVQQKPRDRPPLGPPGPHSVRAHGGLGNRGGESRRRSSGGAGPPAPPPVGAGATSPRRPGARLSVFVMDARRGGR